MTCEKCADDCSQLHFKKMPIIGTMAIGSVIIKCTEHVRSNAALRFTPPAVQEAAPVTGSGLVGSLMPRPPSSAP